MIEERVRVAAFQAGERSVYMAVANGDAAMRRPQFVFKLLMDPMDSLGVSFTYAVMDDEEHGTIYHRAALDALRVVFANPVDPK